MGTRNDPAINLVQISRAAADRHIDTSIRRIIDRQSAQIIMDKNSSLAGSLIVRGISNGVGNRIITQSVGINITINHH